MFLFLLSHSIETDEIDQKDLPLCTIRRDVQYFRSEIVRRLIPPNGSFCIEGHRAEPYLGNLSFVFNKLSGLRPVIYYTLNGSKWRRTIGYAEAGGASTGRYRGFIYIHNPGTGKAEVNIGYTTFLNECQDFFISARPDDYITLTNKLGKYNCYFNGINGRQKLKLYSNNTKCNCLGKVYPKAPDFVSTYTDDLTFINDQGSVQMAMYRCSHSYRKSKNYLSVDADQDNDRYVYSTIGSIPSFYPKTHVSSNLGLILGLSLGIPFGIMFLTLAVVACVTDCFDGCDCCSDCCDCCCEGCGCTCKCDMVPNRMKERIIKDYSYSDDRPSNVPDFQGDSYAV
jgi:hypothetical protein